MKIIVLNQKNLIPDGQNNKLIYKFPNSVQFKDNFIAVSSVSMYYSWFNITTAYLNNYFTYNWTKVAVTTTYTITIPDGLYEITTLNDLLQFNFIEQGLYLVNADGQNVYYAKNRSQIWRVHRRTTSEVRAEQSGATFLYEAWPMYACTA